MAQQGAQLAAASAERAAPPVGEHVVCACLVGQLHLVFAISVPRVVRSGHPLPPSQPAAGGPAGGGIHGGQPCRTQAGPAVLRPRRQRDSRRGSSARHAGAPAGCPAAAGARQRACREQKRCQRRRQRPQRERQRQAGWQRQQSGPARDDGAAAPRAEAQGVGPAGAGTASACMAALSRHSWARRHCFLC